MVIKNATTNDIKALLSIKPSLSLEIINDRLKRQENGEVEFLILENNNQPLSFVLLKWNSKYPDMEDLYTKESERGRGYGTLLITECERLAKEKGFDKIGLAVNPTLNSLAHKLYLRLGYQSDGTPPYIDGVYNGVEDWCIKLYKLI